MLILEYSECFKLETVVESCWLNFMVISEAEVCGAVELYCIILRGDSRTVYFHTLSHSGIIKSAMLDQNNSNTTLLYLLNV